MSRSRAPYDDIVVATPVTIPYVRFSIRGAPWWIGRALGELVRNSGIEKDRIDGFCVSSFNLAPDTSIGLSQHLGISTRWLDFVPLGGNCGVVSLRRAARAVQSGDAEIVACVAGDTNHVDSFRQGQSNFSRFARDAVYPIGAGGPNASFAYLTNYYMRVYGAEPADFGKMCVAQRQNALTTPHAMFKKPLGLDEYLNSRLISDPIRLFDCVMPCAGAEGFLVMRRATAEAYGIRYARLLATIERHGAFEADPIQFRGGWAMERDELYGQAGVTPGDIDFVETYDDYPVINMLQFEDLGFCGKGEAPALVRANTLTSDGTFPFNTSGGQLSVGQAGAAGGMLGTVEAIRQLTGQTYGDPVPNARLGLVCGFGMINYDRGLSTGAAILAAA
jgi:acetyl-CoA acetyltransferase